MLATGTSALDTPPARQMGVAARQGTTGLLRLQTPLTTSAALPMRAGMDRPAGLKERAMRRALIITTIARPRATTTTTTNNTNTTTETTREAGTRTSSIMPKGARADAHPAVRRPTAQVCPGCSKRPMSHLARRRSSITTTRMIRSPHRSATSNTTGVARSRWSGTPRASQLRFGCAARAGTIGRRIVRGGRRLPPRRGCAKHEVPAPPTPPRPVAAIRPAPRGVSRPTRLSSPQAHHSRAMLPRPHLEDAAAAVLLHPLHPRVLLLAAGRATAQSC